MLALYLTGERRQLTINPHPPSVTVIRAAMSQEEATTDTSTGAATEAAYARSLVFLGQGRSPPFVTESTRLPAHLSPGEVSQVTSYFTRPVL